MTTPFGTQPNARLTVGDIATRVKRQFGDEVGAQITDADIIRWINDAQRELSVQNDLLQSKATASIAAGTAEYALPVDMLTLHSVRYDSIKLRSMTLTEAEKNIGTGVPVGFTVWASKLTLVPTPQSALASGLSILYTRNPTAVSALADIPELPAQYHNRIVDYCVAMALELDDNMAAAQAKMAAFTSGAQTLRHNEEANQQFYPSLTMTEDYGDWGGYLAWD